MKGLKLIAAAGISAAALSVSAQAADLYAPVPEQYVASQWDAFLAARIGYTWFDVPDEEGGFFIGEDDIDLDDWVFDARATGAYIFANNIGFQGDLTMAIQNLGEVDFEGDVGLDAKTTDLAAHLFYREPGSWLIGVIGQYGFTSFDFGGEGVDFDRYYLGLEGQAYFGAFTLYAQGGYANVSMDNDFTPDADGFFLNGQLRYFATPNWVFIGSAGYQGLEASQGGDSLDIDVWTLGLHTEYRIDNTPFSLTLSYDYTNTDFEFDGDGADLDESRIMAGIKLNLGTQTLLERDRAGASLDPVRPALFSVPAFMGRGMFDIDG